MSELIDREAVIDLLKKMRKDGDMVPWEGKDVFARIRKLPTIQPEERTEKRTKTHACDLISRQAAIDALDKQIKQCCKALGSLSLSDVDKHAVEVEMASLRAYREMLENLPTVQPEPTDIDAREAVYNLAEKIGIHQLFALTVELRGEPIQPELTYEQVEEYCKKRCLHVVTADFFESTKPQRLGHWIKHIDPLDGEQYECSECGVLWEFTDGTPEDNEAYYCPKCGAKMRGERQK